jgi:hypothetical protein
VFLGKLLPPQSPSEEVGIALPTSVARKTLNGWGKHMHIAHGQQEVAVYNSYYG